MDALQDGPSDSLRIGRQIDHVNVPARRHDRADRTIPQSHDAGDHCALARLDHAGGFRFRNECLDFIIRDPLLRLPAIAECAQNQAPGNVQQPDDRGGDFCEHRHGGRHRTAILSGSRSAICFGTSSPTIKDT